MTKMLDDTNVDRRTVLRGVGAAAAAGMLAGCSGGDGGDGSDGGDGGDGSDGGDGGSGGGVPSEVESYLSEAKGYDGSIADETGSSSVTVDVGAGSGLAFAPAAVRVGTGTTVTWEWTGQGGAHNVVAEDGAFDSGETMNTGTFEHTFEESGIYTYYCTPHKGVGMKGAIVVE
jgi:halocyanin-like protein